MTGIGQKNAERVVREALADVGSRRRETADAKETQVTIRALTSAATGFVVFTCGFAGGLNPALALGDVVFEPTDAGALRDKLLAAGARPVKFFCATRIATTVAEKQELRRASGADAVEMESEVIHAICRERGIPCATVRVISDTANEDLPLDFNRLSKPDLSLDYGKLLLAIAKSPGKIPALWRLRRNSRFAAKRLVEALEKVIGPR